jgi:hypothetical protein
MTFYYMALMPGDRALLPRLLQQPADPAICPAGTIHLTGPDNGGIIQNRYGTIGYNNVYQAGKTMRLQPVMNGQSLPIELFINAIAQVNGDGRVAQGVYREGCRRVHCTRV